MRQLRKKTSLSRLQEVWSFLFILFNYSTEFGDSLLMKNNEYSSVNSKLAAEVV